MNTVKTLCSITVLLGAQLHWLTDSA